MASGSAVPRAPTYYSYDRRLLKRMLSLKVLRRPYCPKCRKWVKMHSPMLGIPLEESEFPDFEQSALVRSMLDKDWSVLNRLEPLYDWARQPSIYVSIGRCETCDGPFVVLGDVHGFAHGTMHLGHIFLLEVERDSGKELLETAIKRDFIANDKRFEIAVEYCKSLGSSSDFSRLAWERERRWEAIKRAKRADADRQRGSLNEAEDGLERAIQIFVEIEDTKRQALATLKLGDVHNARGAFGQAQALFAEALTFFEALGAEPEAAITCWCLGHIHLDRMELDQAEQRFRRFLEINTSLGSEQGIIDGRQALATVDRAKSEGRPV